METELVSANEVMEPRRPSESPPRSERDSVTDSGEGSSLSEGYRAFLPPPPPGPPPGIEEPLQDPVRPVTPSSGMVTTSPSAGQPASGNGTRDVLWKCHGFPGNVSREVVSGTETPEVSTTVTGPGIHGVDNPAQGANEQMPENVNAKLPAAQEPEGPPPPAAECEAGLEQK